MVFRRLNSRGHVGNPKQAGAGSNVLVGTAETYARSVAAYARARGLYHGEDYESLGDYMLSALTASSKASDSTVADDRTAPRLYTWNDPEGGRRLQSVAELTAYNFSSEQQRGSVLILSGHQNAEWLNAVGSKLHLDPAFFHNHLDFKAAYGGRELFATPGLPSADEGIVRLKYTTIGIRENALFNDVTSLRKRGSYAMERYMQHLDTMRNLKHGDSMVRRYHVHTHKYFSLMQHITIGVHKAEQSWQGQSL